MRVKICGLTDEPALEAAQRAGAAYLGFVFFHRSPRCLTPGRAAELTALVTPGLARVGLFVDPDDALLGSVLDSVGLDMLQLHGSESAERVQELRRQTGLPVMKAVGISDAADLAGLDLYQTVADQILVDAKPPRGAQVPGGNGVAFDWRLIAGRRWACPWMLAGGLTPGNAAAAAGLTGAQQLDVSTGVERAPGVKDPALIDAFMKAAG